MPFQIYLHPHQSDSKPENGMGYHVVEDQGDILNTLQSTCPAIESHVPPWHLRQIGCRLGDRLITRLLVVGDADYAVAWLLTRRARGPLQTAVGQSLRAGNFIEARNLLAPIYSWYTEGFDTPDLQDAKLVLDQLA
jgi:hypothetical protein